MHIQAIICLWCNAEMLVNVIDANSTCRYTCGKCNKDIRVEVSDDRITRIVRLFAYRGEWTETP